MMGATTKERKLKNEVKRLTDLNKAYSNRIDDLLDEGDEMLNTLESAKRAIELQGDAVDALSGLITAERRVFDVAFALGDEVRRMKGDSSPDRSS